MQVFRSLIMLMEELANELNILPWMFPFILGTRGRYRHWVEERQRLHHPD